MNRDDSSLKNPMRGCKELLHCGCGETHGAEEACFLLQFVALQKKPGLKESYYLIQEGCLGEGGNPSKKSMTVYKGSGEGANDQ